MEHYDTTEIKVTIPTTDITFTIQIGIRGTTAETPEMEQILNTLFGRKGWNYLIEY